MTIDLEIEYNRSEHLSHQHEYPEFIIGELVKKKDEETQAAETQESRAVPVLRKQKHRAVNS